MTGLDLTSFAETLSKGLKLFLKGENVKVKDLDFQELENKIIMEFELPYKQQMQTPTQLLNNFTKQNIVDTIRTSFPNAPVKYQKHGTDPRNYRVNFQKIRKHLGFEPQYSIEDGVQELVSALQQKLFDRVEQQPNFYGNYSIKFP